MRRFMVFMPVFLLLVIASASAQETSHFPLDQGRVWIFDDGNADKIDSFTKIETTDGSLPLSIFHFSAYNFTSRWFYRAEAKVYEWKAGYRRLWYDFGAQPGDSWEMKWEAVPGVDPSRRGPDERGWRNGPDSDSPVTAEDLEDINSGATVTLVADDEKVTVPYGEFGNVYHFRITRPGVADAGYVEEWFAPDTGCVQRVWDTIAGPHQQRLEKIFQPEPEVSLRMDITLDKEGYLPGEDVNITVSVLNWSDREVTLEFPTSLQVDYTIDGVYTYSQTHPALTAVTKVTIPARDVVKWTFTHTAKDYALAVGKHFIRAELIGAGAQAEQTFPVYSDEPYLPRGISRSVTMSKDVYAQGEPIRFTLTVANHYEQDYTLTLPVTEPVKYRVDQLLVFPAADAPELETATVTIPSGESRSWDVELSADDIALEPGYYTLFAGLRGYSDEIYAKFGVRRDLTYGTVSGYVTAIPGDPVKSSLDPVAGATVTLTPVTPKNFERDMSILPVTGEDTPRTAETDANGFFTLADVPVGAFYVLQVEKAEYLPYSATLRTLDEETRVSVTLRQPLLGPPNSLNYRSREIAGLLVTIGTDQSVYQPESPVTATFSIRNNRPETVTFSFESEEYVRWSLDDGNSAVELDGDGAVGRSAGGAEYTLVLQPGEAREFVRTSGFAEMTADTGGKYAIRAEFRFTACSVAELNPGDLDDSIKMLMVPSVCNRLDARGHNREMVVDLRECNDAFINIVTRNDDVEGEIAVSGIGKNYHAVRNHYRFVKMVEVDADSSIRADMDSALVRIYYREEDFGEGFKPENLVISHWDDKSDHPAWEDLPTRVDTVNRFVEAGTASFSSFGLFEKDAATEVDDTVPATFRLEQNVPNPFNPATVIRFAIPVAGTVRLSIFNVTGQEVASLVNGPMQAGAHEVVFQGSRLGSGVYFYRLTAPGFTKTRKMLLIK